MIGIPVLILMLTVGVSATTIKTVAGGGEGGPATLARPGIVSDIAHGPDGAVYFVDSERHLVQVIQTDGTLRTLVGSGTAGFSGDGGPGIEAEVARPLGIAVGQTGDVYIADTDNHRIRRIDASGDITTIGGTGVAGFSGDGGPGTDAQLSQPVSVAVDAAGFLYVADFSNRKIRRISPSGVIEPYAGREGQLIGSVRVEGVGGAAIEAEIGFPRSLSVGPAGSLYFIGALNEHVLRIDARGKLSIVAGGGETGFTADGASAFTARLQIGGIDVGSDGTVHLVDAFRVRRIESGLLVTLGGTGVGEYAGLDGAAADASFPAGKLRVSESDDVVVTATTVDNSGDDLVFDSRVMRIEAGGAIETILGGDMDRPVLAVLAELSSPGGVAAGVDGELYLTDSGRHVVLRVDSDGGLSTVAGTNVSGDGADFGAPLETALNIPRGVWAADDGSVYLSDAANHKVRRILPAGIDPDFPEGLVVTVAGTGTRGSAGDGGPGTDAELNFPAGLAVDSAGAVFVADTQNHRIRRIGSDGTITTVAGNGVQGSGGDGGPAIEASLHGPSDVWVDGVGRIFIADEGNDRVRRVDEAGVITTIAGPDLLKSPAGIAVDGVGNLLVSEKGGHRIRRIVKDEDVETIAGDGNAGRRGDGGLAASARLNRPGDLGLDRQGNLLVVDTGNRRIRQIQGVGVFPPPYPVASADFDGDGVVGFGDFLMFTEVFGTGATGFDLDGSGTVDFADFLGFAAVFGERVTS